MKELTKGNKLATNTAALGATLQLLGIESEPLEAVVTRQFKKKGDAVVSENIAIAPAGYESAAQNFQAFTWKTPRGAKPLGVISLPVSWCGTVAASPVLLLSASW
jgi:hypothetical protein